MKKIKYSKPELEKNILVKDGDGYYVGRVTDEYAEDDNELCIQNSEGAIINIEDHLEWHYVDDLILNSLKWEVFLERWEKLSNKHNNGKK